MEFWTVERLVEFKDLLETNTLVHVALAEMGDRYGRKLSRGSMRKRFVVYFGAGPSAFLMVPEVQRYQGPVPNAGTIVPKRGTIEAHGFADSTPAPIGQGQKSTPDSPPSSRIVYHGVTSLAFLADVHLDPDTPPCSAWKAAKRFVADKQPETIVLGGDFLHMASLSHWDLSKRGLVEGRRYYKDIELANAELDELQNACPSAQFHFLEGNHEAWVSRYCDNYPEIKGHMDLQRDLGLAGRRIQWTPENDVLKVGKMRYLHGWYYSMYHAKKTALQLGASCMYGHVHKPQLFTLEQRCRGQIQGISVGCLCELNPSYRRGQPTNWLQGFGFVEYRESGEFQATSISIVNGALTFGGETWRG